MSPDVRPMWIAQPTEEQVTDVLRHMLDKDGMCDSLYVEAGGKLGIVQGKEAPPTEYMERVMVEAVQVAYANSMTSGRVCIRPEEI